MLRRIGLGQKVAIVGTVIALLLGTVPAGAETLTIGNAPTVDEIPDAVDYKYELDAPVLRLYQAFFNRAPDRSGARYWLTVRRSGFNDRDISGFMANSQEFKNLYDGTSDEVFVERVYSNVLGRDFDQAGYIYWLDILKGTNASGNNPELKSTDRPGVVNFITQNLEFTNAFPFGSPHPDGPGENLSIPPGIFNEFSDFAPGVYASTNPESGCIWSAGGTEQANYGSDAPAIQVVADFRATAGARVLNCGDMKPIRNADLGLVDEIAGPADWMVGTQVPPGIYQSRTNGKCAVSRAADANHYFNGKPTEDVITINVFLDPAHMLVEVKEGDAFLQLRHDTCGRFSLVEPDELPAETNPGDGNWLVGSQLEPGTWTASASAGCIWVRLSAISDGSGESGSFIEQRVSTPTVTIEPTDVAFQTTNCGVWTRTG